MPAAGPQHQQMIEQVGAFRRQFLATFGERRDHHLDGFLAGLLGDLGAALGEAVGRYRRSPRRRRAGSR